MFDMMDFESPMNNEDYIENQGPNVPDAMDCMRCGICVNQCPTYLLTQDENESPRQRIRTLSQLLIENKSVDSKAMQHLNNCLQCRACEVVCPSQMDYGELYDSAQVQLASAIPRPMILQWLLKMVNHKPLFNVFCFLIWLLDVSQTRWLLRNLGLINIASFQTLDKLLPRPQIKPLVNGVEPTLFNGTVALFTGCLAERFDQTTLNATINVLKKMGYRVIVPKQ